jgi:hypothetical protein
MECAMFKSPVSKLVAFFRKSRDAWKAKCLAAKRQSKRWATQARAVERSRTHWKQVARASRQEVRQLKRELKELKNAAGA